MCGSSALNNIGGYFASLPVDRFPKALAVSAAMFAGDDDDRLAFGLDLLLGGLAALAVRTSRLR